MNNLPKNLNIYWIGATTLAVWFLFIHSPPYLIQRKVWKDLPFSFHLIGVYGIYVACIFNTLWTPSTCKGRSRPYHIWVGRVGMILGVLGFFWGAYCSWWPYRKELPSMSFSIAITVGGIFQMFFQIDGYCAIKRFQALKEQIAELTNGDDGQEEYLEELEEKKKQALSRHIYNMLGLFVMACGVPAFIRMSDALFGDAGVWTMLAGIALLNLAIYPYAKTFLNSSPVVVPDQQPLLPPQTENENPLA